MFLNISEKLSASTKGAEEVSLEGHLRIDTVAVHLPAGQLGKGLSFSLDKKIAYNLREDKLTVERGNLQLGDLPIGLTGTVTGDAVSLPSGSDLVLLSERR